MDIDKLREQALHNRGVFDQALGPYVEIKVEQAERQLQRGSREAWLDATGCVWCLFDDPAFARAGDAGVRLRDELGDAFDLRLYWSMGDVAMPADCDEEWVASRIADEAVKQLDERGYRCKAQTRECEGALHQGVAFRKRHRFFA